MLKKILSYGFVEGIAKGLNKLTLLLLPLLLSNVDYGKVGLIFALEMIVPIISLLGFERAILRFYSQKLEIKNFDGTVFTSIKISHLTLFLVLIALKISGVNHLLGLSVWPDLFLVVLMVYFKGFNLLVLNALRVQEKHKEYFKARFVMQITQLFLVIGLTWLTKSHLGYLFGSILAAFFVNMLFRPDEKIRFQDFDKQTFNRLFVFSWPFIFHGISANMLGSADKFIIEKYMSLADVGTYTLAHSMGSMMAFAFIGVSVYMEPLIYKQESIQARDKMLNNYLLMALTFAVFAYTILSLASKYILIHIYGSNYEYAISIIPLIAVVYMVYPFYLKNSYALIYNKQTKSIASISLISAGLSIVLNFLFIPRFGLYAPIYTLALAYTSQALGFSFIANRMKLKREYIYILVFTTAILLTIYYSVSSIYVIGIFVVIFLFTSLEYHFFKSKN